MPDIAAAIERIAIFLVPLLLGVTCHEVAHGFVAYLHGDDTAKSAGRLTLNPIKHLDPMGSFVFLITAIFSPFVLGWAKPVPVNPYRFKNPRKAMMLVSAAGPATNFVLAVFFALLLRLIFPMLESSPESPAVMYLLYPLALICHAGVTVNIILGLFNLLPIPPMDGSKIVAGVLPPSLALPYMQLERFGLLIILVLLGTGILGRILVPALLYLRSLLL